MSTVGNNAVNPVVEQGEQFFQTNYYQGPFDPDAWRGGFSLLERRLTSAPSP